MRTILVHMNVELADDDPRTANRIADQILAMVEVGTPDDDDVVLSLPEAAQPVIVHSVGMKIVCPMAEEVW